VVFISGNMPLRTELAPLLVMTRFEQYHCAGAAALAVVLLGASFALLLAINRLQAWTRSRAGLACVRGGVAALRPRPRDARGEEGARVA
jgi:sulfate transport system permease protein